LAKKSAKYRWKSKYCKYSSDISFIYTILIARIISLKLAGYSKRYKACLFFAAFQRDPSSNTYWPSAAILTLSQRAFNRGGAYQRSRLRIFQQIMKWDRLTEEETATYLFSLKIK